MSRAEFTKIIRRMALKRSGGKCEAIGAAYGLEADTRCNMPLSFGVEFDHVLMEALSHDNSLENCASVCVKCHRHKTAEHDVPMASKALRIFEKRNKLRPKSRGFRSKYRKKMNGEVVLR